jgi:hypothetical protein
LAPGTNVTTDSILNFHLRTSPFEIIRFPEDPFVVYFRHTVKNPIWEKPPARGAAETRELRARPEMIPASTDSFDPAPAARARVAALGDQDEIPAFTPGHPGALGLLRYPNACLNGQSFFRKAEVLIDGQHISKESGLDDFQHFYTVLNRTCMSARHREIKYGTNPLRVRTQDEGQKKPTLAECSKALQSGLGKIMHSSWRSNDSLCLSFGLDGYFPFSNQSNIMAALSGQRTHNGFLHPEVEINVRLYKMAPTEYGFESCGLNDEDHQSDADVTTREGNDEFLLTNLFLVYESMTLENQEELVKYKKNISRYFWDVPKIIHKHVAPNVNRDSITLPIPEGSNAVVVFFFHEAYQYPNSGRNRSSKLLLPPDLAEIQFSVSGRNGLIFQEGFKKLSGTLKNTSLSRLVFHSDLIRQQLYDSGFEYAAPEGNDISYENFFYLNLLYYDLEKQAQLKVDLAYRPSTYSTARWYIALLSIQQAELSYSESTQWQTDIQP